MTVSITDEANSRSPELNSLGVNSLGFVDPSGMFPKQRYMFGPSTNEAARGKAYNDLFIGGGYDGLSFSLPAPVSSQYPYNNVMETLSGHVVEYDDTPGGERILIKHKSGSGIEFRADGSIVMKSESNVVTSVTGSSTLLVEGNADIVCAGNLSLKVAGDLTLDVGGNINIISGGDKKEAISGSSREMVYGTKGSVVRGSRSSTTIGINTDTSLGGLNSIVKGDQKHTVSGGYSQAIGGTSKMTAAGDMIISTPSMTMGASSMSIFGASGTIGGGGMVHYGTTFYGTTFYGDLSGTAEFAITADITNSQTYPPSEDGTALGYSIVEASDATAAASSDTMDAYLNQSAYGVVQVSVDEGDFIKNTIDKTFDTGGISVKDLTTREVRSKLRDPANMGNPQFMGYAISSEKISPTYTKTVPSKIDRIASSDGTVRTPYTPIVSKFGPIDRYKPKKSSSAVVMPAFEYNPNNAPTIAPTTLLAKGVSLAKFLGGIGDKVTLSHIATDLEKTQIARQFSLQAKAVSMVLNNVGEFINHRLVVVEGLYKKGPNEVITPDSINDRATRGEAVVYELHDNSGKIDLDKTFELATYWKDNLLFDKLILSYDTFNPLGGMVAQIILIMPTINENFKPLKKYLNTIETHFNNKVQGNELIEIVEP